MIFGDYSKLTGSNCFVTTLALCTRTDFIISLSLRADSVTLSAVCSYWFYIIIVLDQIRWNKTCLYFTRADSFASNVCLDFNLCFTTYAFYVTMWRQTSYIFLYFRVLVLALTLVCGKLSEIFYKLNYDETRKLLSDSQLCCILFIVETGIVQVIIIK